MPRLTTVDWAAVERAYVSGEETVAAIARRHKTSPSTIRSHASRNGWSRASGKASPPAPVDEDRDLHLAERQRIARRLTKAIDRILAKMENRMAHEKKKGTEPTTAADQERDSRLVHSLIRSLEKVTEFEADLDKAGSGRADAADARAFADEAERVRAEIAERLARLGGASPG